MSGSQCATRSVRLEMRRDTAANWTAANPVLLSGEPGFEIDTGKLKIGNGINNWNSLSYIAGGGTAPTSVLDGGGPAAGPAGGAVFDMGSVT